MRSLNKILLEAVVVGLLLIPVTYIAGSIAKQITSKPALPDICKSWNKYYMMEVNVFLAGFVFHLLAEFSGLNAFFVKQYKK